MIKTSKDIIDNVKKFQIENFKDINQMYNQSKNL